MIHIFIPSIVNPRKISVILVCEALPENKNDYFYSSKDSLYVKNVISAFNEAGIKVKTIDEIVKKGVYLTVAVKTIRKGIVVPTDIIKKHSYELEEELSMFPNVKAIILMGDAAIKSFNLISLRVNKTKVIPTGSTYKIRNGKFYFKNARVFPSYLPTGKNFLIEKTKRRMVAEDIRNAFMI